MASRFVPCRDLAHVLEMYDAGLLHVRWYAGWRLAHPDEWDIDSIRRHYSKGWEPCDWAVLVEEDDNPTEDDSPTGEDEE